MPMLAIRGQARRGAFPLIRLQRYLDGMPPCGDKVNLDLDAQLVADTRAAAGVAAGSDTEAVQQALNAYLLEQVVRGTQADFGLSEEDANRVAYEELHAMRRERDAA